MLLGLICDSSPCSISSLVSLHKYTDSRVSGWSTGSACRLLCAAVVLLLLYHRQVYVDIASYRPVRRMKPCFHLAQPRSMESFRTSVPDKSRAVKRTRHLIGMRVDWPALWHRNRVGLGQPCCACLSLLSCFLLSSTQPSRLDVPKTFTTHQQCTSTFYSHRPVGSLTPPRATLPGRPRVISKGPCVVICGSR